MVYGGLPPGTRFSYGIRDFTMKLVSDVFSLNVFILFWIVWISRFIHAATKVEQASQFNDPDDDCSILVATDAVGMGLNL